MARYDFISTHEVQGMLPVLKDGKWGLVSYDDFDKEIVQPTWDTMPEERRGCVLIQHKGKFGILDSEGNEVLPPLYDNVYVANPNRIVIERADEKYAIFDMKGNAGIPFKSGYNLLDYHEDKRIIAYRNGKCAVIDITEKEIIQFGLYDQISWDDSEKMYCVSVNGKEGALNEQGKEIIPPSMDKIYFYPNDILVKNNGKMGVYSYTGECKIACNEYSFITPYGEATFNVSKDGVLYGIISAKNEVIVPIKYNKAHRFINGFAEVELYEKKGFVNYIGEEICKIIHNEVRRFSEGLAAVCFDDAWGVINTEGQPVVEYKYDDIGSFHNGYAIVKLGSKYSVIDKEGNELLPFIYTSIRTGNVPGEFFVEVDFNEGRVRL